MNSGQVSDFAAGKSGRPNLPPPVKPVVFHAWVHEHAGKIFMGIAFILLIAMVANLVFSTDRTGSNKTSKTVYYVNAVICVAGFILTMCFGLASLIPIKKEEVGNYYESVPNE
ncbi:hypothetical protein AL387_gp116 [Salmon gill poxvirus]|uniref:Uncharacterized protein n=1 Tax=Salmon gill poxvirus TaxID=1680908 RepID=A0A0H4Y158_9POXV|nr:hypothetical protein AL387_gp116 [Salmon gill poxvirus]AKR04240.1 hypothetical protein SGPV116 [Salmon gill poxvirus]